MGPYQQDMFYDDSDMYRMSGNIPFWFWWLPIQPGPWGPQPPGPWMPRPPWHPSGPWQPPRPPRPPRPHGYREDSTFL